ncbi:MAG: BlaI/MecI/CopY family transcriptional regulator [Lachnospiraceae bacterium]|jgi:BlaI family penicillinase repressor|nr:BlaI/MecI/CopY family transcriptional regulator [Lachnospiraceae bacterium]
MVDTHLGVVEARFADLIWQHEPIHSRELAKICAGELDWKRPTTYNVLRKLCEKGIFQNDGGIVSSRISRQEFYGMRGEHFVEEAFHGSLPAFVAAFTARKKLSEEEIQELKEIISQGRGEAQ